MSVKATGSIAITIGGEYRVALSRVTQGWTSTEVLALANGDQEAREQAETNALFLALKDNVVEVESSDLTIATTPEQE